jgi:glycosyltransferase involved in cell wall biosynthesis
MMETLQPGFGWGNYGFYKCITTSEFQKDYISTVMRNISIDIVPPVISDKFKKSKFPQKPIVAVHSRDQRKTLNFIKTFYLRFPQYRWITFRDLRGLSEEDFSTFLKDCFLSVWIDETSGYGTFPLESMKCGVPVIGKVPSLFPHWMNEDNGLWLGEETKLCDFTADFIQNWLEDNIKPELYDKMDETVSTLISKEEFETKINNLFSDYITSRETSFVEQLNKLKTEE